MININLNNDSSDEHQSIDLPLQQNLDSPLKIHIQIENLEDGERTKATVHTFAKEAPQLFREEGGSKGHLLSLENPIENIFSGDNYDHIESPYMSNYASDEYVTK